MKKQIAVCVQQSKINTLTVGKSYEVIPHKFVGKSTGFIKIIDDLGDAALYRRDYFQICDESTQKQ